LLAISVENQVLMEMRPLKREKTRNISEPITNLKQTEQWKDFVKKVKIEFLLSYGKI
jgi:hypothetical protein